MPYVLKETTSELFASVFIIFITVIIWWLCGGGAKPTRRPRPASHSLSGRAVTRPRANFSLRGATAPPRDLPAFHFAGASRFPKHALPLRLGTGQECQHPSPPGEAPLPCSHPLKVHHFRETSPNSFQAVTRTFP